MRLVKTSERQELDYDVLNAICDRAFFLALKMIEHANTRPMPKGEPKVGGHPSACASSQHILAAIHLVMRNPEDYLACKPHVSPMDHALNFLMHNFRDADGKHMSEEQRKLSMKNLRHFSPEGEPVFQSYHAEADPDGYRFFPSGSVGIPPVNALYMELAYRLAKDHGFELGEDPYFWCLMGDSEFREGSLAEAMPDGGERELNHQVWIVDYNRQNLDGTRIPNEAALEATDADRICKIAEANGWNAIKLKHGKKRQRLFTKSGGKEFKRVLDDLTTDYEMQALIEANRPELTREVLSKKSSKFAEQFKKMKDEELHSLFLNLGGHCIESLVEAFEEAKLSSKPTLVVAYTIKGLNLDCQAKSGNHSSLPKTDELKEKSSTLGLSYEDPFHDFDSDSPENGFLQERRDYLIKGIDEILKNTEDRRQKWRQKAAQIEWPTSMDISALKLSPMANTQWMWGQIAAKLDRLARDTKGISESSWESFAKFFLTMAPDVGTSTNTSPNMNGKLYGAIGQEDYVALYDAKDKKFPDVVPTLGKRTGHLRFEIAEGNCMSAAGSFGKFEYHTGIPFYPAMTIYDFFIKRCLDQYYYNLYWKSSFATLGTPCGVTLSAEGAQHSWKSDIQIPNSITWEPCFAQELDWIFADTIRRHFTGDNESREASLIRCVTKGLPQKQFLARLKAQKRFAGVSEAAILEQTRKDVLEGAYALIHYEEEVGYDPGDNVVHLFGMGALGMEAVQASDLLKEKGIFANVFIVTSPDLLLGIHAHHNDYQHLRNRLSVNGNLCFPKKGNQVGSKADWLALQGSRIPVVSVHDGEAGLLDNVGSAAGTRQRALAVRKTSKSGSTDAIFAYHHIDAHSIVEAVEKVLSETAKETLQVHPDVLGDLN